MLPASFSPFCFSMDIFLSVYDSYIRSWANRILAGRAVAVGPNRTLIDILDDGENERGPAAEKALQEGVFGPGMSQFV